MGRKRSFDEQDVVRTAIDVFTEQGYAGTDTAELCERAGIARSSFYNSFGTKDALFERALRAYTDTGKPLRAWLRTSADPAPVLIHERIHSALLAQCADDRRTGCLAVNTTAELGRSMEQFSAVLDADREAWLDTYSAVLRRGQTEGHIRPELDPAVQAALVHSTMAGLRVAARISDPVEIDAQIRAFALGLCTAAGKTALLAHLQAQA